MVVFCTIYAYFLVKHASSIHTPVQVSIHFKRQDWWATRRRQHCEDALESEQAPLEGLWLFASEQTVEVVCARP